MTGLNMNAVKLLNASSVLYLINSKGLISRKDIAEILSLTPAAVTKICSRLIEEGLVEETAETENQTKAGRKKILLRLRLFDHYALGINAEVDKITISVVSLEGKCVCSKSFPIDVSIENIIKKSKDILSFSEIPKEKICCVSVCVIGSTQNTGYGMWDVKKLKEQIEASLKLPAVFENNIRAFALAEMIYGRKRYDKHSLFLKWGPGIASAVTSDGEVVSGDDSSLTEIGHYIIRKGGEKCRCGRYGCLETEASTMNIIEEASIGNNIEDIINSRDERIVNIIDEKTDMIALALANTATILNTNKIILFGTMFNNPIVVKKLIKQCGRYNFLLSEENVMLSELNSEITYIGTAALAAKTFFFNK